jgi:ABC-type transporter Mla subunit MlaD
MKDIRKEQVVLLRFEKQLAGLAATLATGAALAKGVDDKLGSAEASEAIAKAQGALMDLAHLANAAHHSLNAAAMDVGARVLQTSGGIPKEEPPQVIARLLGLG